MKKTLLVFLLVVLMAACIPNTQTPAPAPEYESDNDEPGIIEGHWYYSCDMFGVNRYTWKSTLKFEHATMIVLGKFSDFDLLEEENPKAFSIYSALPKYKDSVVFAYNDGSFDAAQFANESYPGGYTAFEKELVAMNIDWITMYEKTRTEFLLMYASKHYHCPTGLDFTEVQG